MNVLLAWLDGPVASRLGWTLVHSLWQGAVAALLFAVVRLALRRASAQSRYLSGCCALMLMAATPALTFIAQPAAMFPFTPRVTAVALANSSAAMSQGGFVAAQLQDSAFVLLFQAADALQSTFPWVVAGWVLGVSILLVRWLQGCWWVRQARRFAAEGVEAELLGRLNDLKCRLEIFRPVRLLKSALVEVPMVVGWLRPVILLPASSLTGLTPQQLETILAHELAHVRRYDYLVNVFQTLVETLLFYHPAVWWISRCVREERENCCDDLVVRLYEDRIPYARALMTLETLRGAPLPAAMGAGGGSLLQRVQRLLGKTTTEQPPGAREFSALALVALGAVFVLFGLGLMFRGEVYQATCRIRLESHFLAGVSANNRVMTFDVYNPYFIQTEFEVIQSPAVLNRVVNSLQLATAWAQHRPAAEKLSPNAVLARLRSRMTLRPIRNTSLIEIVVREREPTEAARLANAIGYAYQQYHLENERAREEQSLRVLEQHWEETEHRVASAQEKVDELRSKLGIANTGEPGSLGTSYQPRLSAETLRHLEQLRIETQADLVRQQTLLEKLNALKNKKAMLAEVIPAAGIQDTLLVSLLEQRTAAEQRLVALQREYGPQYTEVIKVTSQLADLKDKLQQREDGILLGLEAKIASLEQSMAQLEKEVNETVQADLAAAAREQPYFAAKMEVEKLQGFRQVLSAKLASERLEAEMPHSSVVEIIEQAAVPASPTSPNRERAGALLGSGLLLIVFGLLLIRCGPRILGVPAVAT